MKLLKNEQDHKYYFDLILNKDNKYTAKDYQRIIEDWTKVKLKEKYLDFYSAPASTKYHGDHECGLIQHSIGVYYFALRLAEAFNMKQEDIDVVACIFHDLCKANGYRPSKVSTQKYAINTDNIICHHGDESLLRLAEHGVFLSDPWKISISYHMGAFASDDMPVYGNATSKYKEVLLLHTADMMASHILKV